MEALEDSMLLRFQVLRIEAMHLRARAALASARLAAHERLQLAEKLARQIEQEKMPWAMPFVSWCAERAQRHPSQMSRLRC